MAKSVVREVKILDAVLKEDEGTEDEPTIVQYIWLQIQDIQTSKISSYQLTEQHIQQLLLQAKVIACPHCQKSLTLEQVNDIANLSRNVESLSSKDMIDFSIRLKNRDKPVFLEYDPEQEITFDIIKNEEGI
jgi:hypothetical protein